MIVTAVRFNKGKWLRIADPENTFARVTFSLSRNKPLASRPATTCDSPSDFDAHSTAFLPPLHAAHSAVLKGQNSLAQWQKRVFDRSPWINAPKPFSPSLSSTARRSPVSVMPLLVLYLSLLLLPVTKLLAQMAAAFQGKTRLVALKEPRVTLKRASA
jgi:hypothetical protein